jgi:glutathione S-transferase
MASALTWAELELAAAAVPREDRATSAASSSNALVRTFGQPEAAAARVVLFRDNHAWCPYCQKVWLWLEASRVPYTVRKVTMRCYLGAGEKKEPWFTALVPSGMLPALTLDGTLVTESDVILARLEAAFGPLGGQRLEAPEVLALRRLERQLFRVWCDWLCYPSSGAADEAARRDAFLAVARRVADALEATPGPFFFGDDLGTSDVVFIPYVERMCASLFYFKGFDLRATFPPIARFFAALERLPAYAGTQSDFHTHAHDLPPQMGGCFASGDAAQRAAAALVDSGPYCDVPDTAAPEPPSAALEAVGRVAAFREPLARVNPDAAPGRLDAALRCALTSLASGSPPPRPPAGSAAGLRYVRDRVNVPRDMGLWAARRLRAALEATAALDAPPSSPYAALTTEHRRDQNPLPFRRAA